MPIPEAAQEQTQIKKYVREVLLAYKALGPGVTLGLEIHVSWARSVREPWVPVSDTHYNVIGGFNNKHTDSQGTLRSLLIK